MSPEVIKGTAYSEKADIYSLAMVAWEIVTGKCPFEGMSQLEVWY
jgi:serine/threonine protein kinase